MSEIEVRSKTLIEKYYDLYKDFKKQDSFALTSFKTSLAATALMWKERLYILCLIFFVYIVITLMGQWFQFRGNKRVERNLKISIHIIGALYIAAVAWIIIFPWMGWR